MTVILGAGLAGLSCSYHLGSGSSILLEAKPHPFGHVNSIRRDGFTWDQGPHVSFTKDEYVRDLFRKSVEGELEEYPVKVVNYYRDRWIDHPAQSNLYQVPEPLRTACLESFLSTRGQAPKNPPHNYYEWLCAAFGPVFTDHFPSPYTRKYWTCDPRLLTTDWIGARVFNPDVDDVKAGYVGPAPRATHYITHVRYPRRGGYRSFAEIFRREADVRIGHAVQAIDFRRRELHLSGGETIRFDRLINTLPLPELIRMAAEAPGEVQAAAERLTCTGLVLVEVTAAHPTQHDGHWYYVYDPDKYATRINCTENLSRLNSPAGHTGIQVEVYHSKYRPLTISLDELGRKVCAELEEMGLIKRKLLQRPEEEITISTRAIPYANVVFDEPRRQALDIVLAWLAEWGLHREEDDLEPTSNWAAKPLQPLGSLMLAGRFGQWKYFWTDDCVLRGRYLAECLR